MAGAARGGRLDGMNPNIPTPTALPAADPIADPAVDPIAAAPYPVPRSTPTPPAQFRLRRSRTDRMLGGVCGGLARDLGADAALLRVLVVALTLISGGAAALVYLAAWVLAPEDDRPA